MPAVSDIGRTPSPYCDTRPRRPSTAPSSLDSELGYHSQSERLPSHYPPTKPIFSPINSLQRRKGSSLASVAFPPASSNESHSSSSYVHISPPSPSTSFPYSASENAFVAPRRAPRPPTSSFLRSPRAPKASKASRSPRSHPHASIPIHQCHTSSAPIPQLEWALPTPAQLEHAASLPVIAASGLRIPFGSLFATQRTIVIFIRHFWCPLCQDYMSSLTSLVQPEMLHLPPASPSPGPAEQVQLVVISNGAHTLITKYRQIFNMPFAMYTDPSLALYTALSMGRDGMTRDLGAIEEDLEENVDRTGKGMMVDGGYVKHGLMGGIAMVVVRALRVAMPVWEKGGDINQLGGEFVFGPGLKCTYAHRMQSTKGHVPILDVVKAAGVDVLPPIRLRTLNGHISVSQSLDALPVRGRARGDSLKSLRTDNAWTNHRDSIEEARHTQNAAFVANTREHNSA
ncbi:hypothetical protein BD779DRAFT_563437 [Infundibulicybe gibba]|nr:hypothetical protein BD779DRAFT_563437 [Infundibulicybe gibba]